MPFADNISPLSVNQLQVNIFLFYVATQGNTASTSQWNVFYVFDNIWMKFLALCILEFILQEEVMQKSQYEK